jgi:tetratricopeptide (TPR) repeat protein
MPAYKVSPRYLSPDKDDSGPRFSVAQAGVFRKEGKYWSIGRGEHTVRLRDARGLGYIAHLLHHPNAEFHALDLLGGIANQRDEGETGQWVPNLNWGEEELEKAGINITGPGDAGEMLDDQAKGAYRRRLYELREELEAAKEIGNIERAEMAEEEIDALTKELSRAVSLGGRNRRAASASERARQSVTKSIKSVLKRIAQRNAALGDLFSRCIKTGTFCCYRPDHDFPIEWQFAATNLDSPPAPAQQPMLTRDPLAAHVDQLQAPPVVLDVSPFSHAERTAFVGRQAERDRIRAIIDRAVSGLGSLVMLAGGPGVGKSRLAMEMADYASRVGFKCLVGHCYERDEPLPYLPVVEIIESSLAQAANLDDFRRRMGNNAPEFAQLAPSLRRVFPDIPEALELPAAQKRFYLFRSLSEALGRAARTHSYLYIFEDLHWADESTLALLVHLASRITRLPVVIIGTYRDGYLDRSPALIRTVEELIRVGIRPMKLVGLPKDAVAQMVNGLSRRQAPENLVSLIFDGSQGNPFFVEELYRHLHEEGKVFDRAGQFRSDITSDEIDVPENVRLIISRRLERLDDSAQLVLAAAAVIGRSFSFQLLNEINHIDVDDLFTIIEKAQQMGIIVPSAEGPERPFTFAHELVRQTLLADISIPRQQRLHASVADAIEQLHPETVGERAADIADHLVKAGSFADRRRLVHFLTLAGKRALAAAAFEEAAHSLRRSLSYLTGVDIRESADLLASLAIAERGLGRLDASSAALREALDLYITLDDRRMIARICTQLIGTFVWALRPQEAIETARRGLSYLGKGLDGDRVRLLAALGQAYGAAGSWEQANEVLNEALSLASHLCDPGLAARLHGACSTVDYQFLRLREAVANGEKARGAEARPWERTLELQYLYHALLTLGRLDEAAKIRDELEPLATKINQSYSIARCLVARAELEFGKTPDLSKLETALQHALKSDPQMPSPLWDVFSGIQLSILDFLRGNWTTALRRAQELRGLEADTFLRGAGVGTLFRQMAYSGDRSGALAIFHEERASLPRSGRPNSIGSWWMLALVIEGLFILGEHSQARELYPLTRELVSTEALVLWPIFRFTHTIAGMAAAASREWEAAEDYFQAAMQQAEFVPHHLEHAEIRRFQAMMLMDRALPADRALAKTLLNEAIENYQHVGMLRHSEITKALLR